MSDEKKSESIMVRITPELLQRVVGVSTRTGLPPAVLARMGLIEVTERLSAQAPEISPEIAAIVATARARGLDVRKVLTDALEAQLSAEAAAAPDRAA